MAFDRESARFWLGDEDLGEFDYTKMTVQEARYFKTITGITPLQMMNGFEIGDPDAMCALVWILWRRMGRQVDFRVVDFALGDLKVKDKDGNEPTQEDLEAGPTQAAPSATTPSSPDTTSSSDGTATSPRSLISST